LILFDAGRESLELSEGMTLSVQSGVSSAAEEMAAAVRLTEEIADSDQVPSRSAMA
jgi:hypothetical protein